MYPHAATAYLDVVALADPRAAPRSSAGCLELVEERQFLEMHDAYARSGGLIGGADLALRLRERCDQPLSKLARWIVERRIVCIHRHEHMIIPLFQFDPVDLAPTPCVAAVLRELNGALDAWDIAAWFVQPNLWLRGATPVDVIAREPQAVIEAARVDRYIVRG